MVGPAPATIEWCTDTKLDDAAQAAAIAGRPCLDIFGNAELRQVRATHILVLICLYAAQAIATPSTSQVDAV